MITAQIGQLAGKWAMATADNALSESNMDAVNEVAFSKKGQSFCKQFGLDVAPGMHA